MNTYLILFTKCLFPSLKQGQCFISLLHPPKHYWDFVLFFYNCFGYLIIKQIKNAKMASIVSIWQPDMPVSHIDIPPNTNGYH